MASVAVNTLQIPVQPNAAGTNSSSAPETGSVESLFASILANETALEPSVQNVARPANDSAPMQIDQAVAPQIPEIPVSAASEAPILLAESLVTPLEAVPAKAPAAPNDSKPVEKASENAPTDNNALAALMLPQTMPVLPKQIPVKAEVSGDLTAQPVAASQDAPLEAAAPQQAAPPSSVPDAQTEFVDEAAAAQDAKKPQAAARDAGTAKNELPKEIIATPVEAQRTPVTTAEKPEQSSPLMAAAKAGSDTSEHQGQDRQPRERDERGAQPQSQSQPIHRADAPLFANNNSPVTQPVAPVKVDAPLPMNPMVGEISQAAPATQNTAATLLSVSTLRDAAPLQPNVQSMAVQIASYSANDVKHFEIRMDPAELGRVDVHLTLDDAGKAQASLIVEKPHALELLQKDSINLERALKEAGIDLSNNGLNFSLKGQERQQDNDARANARSRNNQMQATANIDAPARSSNHFSSGNSGLDIHV